MTDLPQIERALVDAAARRYGPRRGRLALAGRRGLAPAVLVPAAAVVALTVIRLGVGDEAAAPRPEPTRVAPRTVEQAFAVFRRPATAEERALRRLPIGSPRSRVEAARQVARLDGKPYYLATGGRYLCLYAPGVGGGCGPAAS